MESGLFRAGRRLDGR